MTREDYINTLELDNAELKQENKKLKSILKIMQYLVLSNFVVRILLTKA